MKKLLFFVLFACLAFSCKKTGSPGAKEYLLSKVYDGNELRYEFEYNANRRLSRLKKYPKGSLTANVIYEYKHDGKGRLIQKTYINGLTGIAGVTYKYEWNNSDQLVKHLAYDASGADSGNLSMWATYTYNAYNRMIKHNNYFADDKPAGHRVWDYADDGTVLSIKQYGEKPAGSFLADLWEYSGGSGQINPGIAKAWVEPGEMELLFFDATEIDITHYKDGLVDTKYKYKMTDRKAIGTGGQWSEQVISYLQTFPGPSTLIDSRKMKYEYVEK